MKNSIFRKSSYVKSNLKKKNKKKIKKKRRRRRRRKELEFRVKFLTLLDFHQIEFFIETQFSKNQVSKRGILLHLLDERANAHFGP